MTTRAISVPAARKVECGKRRQTKLAMLLDPALFPAGYDRQGRHTSFESTHIDP